MLIRRELAGDVASVRDVVAAAFTPPAAGMGPIAVRPDRQDSGAGCAAGEPAFYAHGITAPEPA